MADYIILRNSVEQADWLGLTQEQRDSTSGSAPDLTYFKGKRFKVVFREGYRSGLRKSGTMNETIGGAVDRSAGAIFFEWQGTIRTRHTLTAQEITDKWGTLADLRAYYVLNNPQGTPTDVITLTDHLGEEHDGFLIGDHLPDPMITQITGNEAHYFISVAFRQKGPVT